MRADAAGPAAVPAEGVRAPRVGRRAGGSAEGASGRPLLGAPTAFADAGAVERVSAAGRAASLLRGSRRWSSAGSARSSACAPSGTTSSCSCRPWRPRRRARSRATSAARRARGGAARWRRTTGPLLDEPFELLLRLFAHEDALEELGRALRRAPEALEFYSPQLVTFVLYGAHWDCDALRAFLLAECAGSLHIAHRAYWFLLAYGRASPGLAPAAKSHARRAPRRRRGRGRARARARRGRRPGRAARAPPARALGRQGRGRGRGARRRSACAARAAAAARRTSRRPTRRGCDADGRRRRGSR